MLNKQNVFNYMHLLLFYYLIVYPLSFTLCLCHFTFSNYSKQLVKKTLISVGLFFKLFGCFSRNNRLEEEDCFHY